MCYTGGMADIPVACYQENLSIIEAYNDPKLQPVVVMKKLDQSRFAILNFFSKSAKIMFI